MIRSMPAFSVWVDAGQPTQAPVSSTGDHAGGLVDVVQDDVAAVGLQAGRITSIVFSTCSRIGDLWVRRRGHSIRPGPYDAPVVNVLAAAGIPAAIVAHQGGWDEMLLVIGADRPRRRPPVAGPPAGHERRPMTIRALTVIRVWKGGNRPSDTPMTVNTRMVTSV